MSKAAQKPSFLTVADEQIEHAEAAYSWLRGNSYKSIKVEPTSIDFPYTPTLTARRGHTTLICDVPASLNMGQMKLWSAYGRTQDRDTRICLVLTNTASLSPKDEFQLKELGIGLLISMEGGQVFERTPPKDQAVTAGLPSRESMSPGVAMLLSDAYDKFDRGEWRDGFKKACQTVEVTARRRLVARMKAGVQLTKSNGAPSALTAAKVNKQTAGQLVASYGLIPSPNAVDQKLESALLHLNADRVRAIHDEDASIAERSLRKNVGRNMIVVINALTAVADG